MTALSDAAKAVVEARSRVIVYLTNAGLSAPRAAANADALIAAVRHHDAEVVRADTGHIRYGSATDYAERHANLLSPAADASPEVEVRYTGGPTIRIAGYSVTTDGPLEILLSDGRKLSLPAAGSFDGTM